MEEQNETSEGVIPPEPKRQRKQQRDIRLFLNTKGEPKHVRAECGKEHLVPECAKAELESRRNVPQTNTVDAVRMEWPEKEATEKSRPGEGRMTRAARIEQTKDAKDDMPCRPETTTVDAVGVEEWPEEEAAEIARPVEGLIDDGKAEMESIGTVPQTTTVDAVRKEEWPEEEAAEKSRPVGGG